MISTAVAAGRASVAHLTGPHNPRRRRAEGAGAAGWAWNQRPAWVAATPDAPQARRGLCGCAALDDAGR